ISDLERIPDDYDRLKIREQGLPERQSETIARILPTPDWLFGKTLNQKLRLCSQGHETAVVKVSVTQWRQIPGSAQRIQDLVVKLNKTEVFPKAVGIVSGRRHQLIVRAQVKAAAVE